MQAVKRFSQIPVSRNYKFLIEGQEKTMQLLSEVSNQTFKFKDDKFNWINSQKAQFLQVMQA
jgi:hypothetical protein